MEQIIKTMENSRARWIKAYQEATDIEMAYYYRELVAKVEYALFTITGDKDYLLYGSQKGLLKKIIE